jgi:aryl-alcohol dehydrogenase (NADP+)
MARLAETDLDVFPLCLGGNVFGWTIDEEASFAVLDAYLAAGGNFIDTADIYGRRSAEGPGTSERIIGRWMAARGNRAELVIATKVGMGTELGGLSATTIRRAAEASRDRSSGSARTRSTSTTPTAMTPRRRSRRRWAPSGD